LSLRAVRPATNERPAPQVQWLHPVQRVDIIITIIIIIIIVAAHVERRIVPTGMVPRLHRINRTHTIGHSSSCHRIISTRIIPVLVTFVVV
jgi:hypothetical protein